MATDGKGVIFSSWVAVFDDAPSFGDDSAGRGLLSEGLALYDP
jgi:hypothetical protein